MDLEDMQATVDMVFAVAFNHDGSRIASGSRRLRIWDAASGEQVRAIKCASEWIVSLAYSADGSRIVTSSVVDITDPDIDTIQVWDAESGEQIASWPADGRWGSVVFSPEGTKVIGSDGNSICAWDANSGEKLTEFTGPDSHGTPALSLVALRSCRAEQPRGEAEAFAPGRFGSLSPLLRQPGPRCGGGSGGPGGGSGPWGQHRLPLGHLREVVVTPQDDGALAAQLGRGTHADPVLLGRVRGLGRRRRNGRPRPWPRRRRRSRGQLTEQLRRGKEHDLPPLLLGGVQVPGRRRLGEQNHEHRQMGDC